MEKIKAVLFMVPLLIVLMFGIIRFLIDKEKKEEVETMKDFLYRVYDENKKGKRKQFTFTIEEGEGVCKVKLYVQNEGILIWDFKGRKVDVQEVLEFNALNEEIDKLIEEVLMCGENLSAETNHQLIHHYKESIEKMMHLYHELPEHLKENERKEIITVFNDLKMELLHKKNQLDNGKVMEFKKQIALLKKRM